MSEKTKEAVEVAKEYLGDAEVSLREAQRFAEKSGDKQLIQKVTKLHEGTQEVRKGIEEKLNNG